MTEELPDKTRFERGCFYPQGISKALVPSSFLYCATSTHRQSETKICRRNNDACKTPDEGWGFLVCICVLFHFLATASTRRSVSCR